MAEKVEARSLASLNYLAANPPKYPTNPAEQKQDPLTLYISRVPGSRDVILSTQKPQVKNVTAEDVASSLYYVHFNHPEDELLIPPKTSHSPSPRSSSERPRTPNQISRKPLPPGNNVPDSLRSDAPDSTAAPPPVPTHGVPLDHQSHLGNEPFTSMAPLDPSISPVSEITRKPVGPNAALPKSLPPLPLEEMPPNLPPRPSEIPDYPPGMLNASQAPHGLPSRSPSPTKRPFNPFSLTLIRRDPSSGQQWNVGRILSMQPADTPEPTDDGRTDDRPSHSDPAPIINIHLETSGYAQFKGGMPMSRPSLGGVDFARPSVDFRPGSAGTGALVPPMNPFAADISAANEGGFERQVMMTYSPSFATNIRKLFNRRRSRDDGERSKSPGVRVGRARGNSVASAASFNGEGDVSAATLTTQPGPGLKPRGYVFMSPWDGRCEFQTGNAGRTLRCRHVLPQLNGGVFNPLVGDGDEDSGSHNRNVHAVSELRFNLPSTELFNKDKKTLELGAPRARDQFQSHVNKILHQRNPSQTSTDEEDDYWMDGLGREKAGGGNRGSRAKMGKLIVAEDGLKMLDLVVAANVGIWWVVWEKTNWNSY